MIAILGGVWRPTQVGSGQPTGSAEVDPVLAGTHNTTIMQPARSGLCSRRPARSLTDGKLELWGGALLARIDALSTRMDVTTSRLEARIEAGEQRLLAELARHAGAIQEAVSRQISVIDEKYADLPARVSQLAVASARRPRRGR